MTRADTPVSLICGRTLASKCWNVGSVSSAALLVFLAGDQRFSAATGTFMTHPTSMQLQGYFPAHQLNAISKSLDHDDERTETIIRDRAPNLPEAILQKRRFGDVHLTADEALAYGIVHEIRPWTVPSWIRTVHIR